MLTELTDSLRGCWRGGGDADLYQRPSRDRCEERQTFLSNSPASKKTPEKTKERKHGEEKERKKNGHSTSSTHT